MILKLTEKNYQKIKNNNKLLILYFKAKWCGACKVIEPIIEEISEMFGDKIIIGEINVDTERNFIRKFAVINIPTILILVNGEVKEKINGVIDRVSLYQKIKKYF